MRCRLQPAAGDSPAIDRSEIARDPIDGGERRERVAEALDMGASDYTVDDLTGLPDRVWFTERLTIALEDLHEGFSADFCSVADRPRPAVNSTAAERSSSKRFFAIR